MQANGTFDVNFETLDPAEEWLGRRRVLKTFEGDLQGSARAEMLAFGTAAGSAGYVAIDQFTGALHGKQGTFVLQHNGIADRGEGSLTVVVIPDSGTGELTGLRGELKIEIVDGKHLYVLDYTLDPA